MAQNEHINKVVKSTGETLIDLTSDTVTAGTLLQDVTAHDRSGAQIRGTVVIPTVNDGTLTIQQNGITKATFTANQSSNSTANIDTADELSLTGAVEGSGTLNNGTISAVTNRKCGLAQHNASGTSATPWYKVADVTLATYRDYTITFYVDSGLEGSANNVGILRVYTRIGASLQSPDHLKIRWLLAGANVNLNSFALSYDKSTGVCAIYANCAGAYTSYRFTVMSESDALNRQDTSIWTVYNATTGIASLPTGDNIVTAYSELATTQTGSQSVKSTNIDRTTNPPSYRVGNSQIGYVDSNGKSIGALFPYRNAAGEEWMSLSAYNQNSSNTEISNSFEIGITKDGTCKYKLSDPTAFRNAIGAGTSSFSGSYNDLTNTPDLSVYMPLSGGTMTGPLEWGDGVGGIIYAPSTYDLQIYNQLADNGWITISSAGKLVLEGHNEVKLQISGGNFVMGEHLFYINLPDENSENLQILRMTYGGGSELMIDGSGYVGKSSSSRDIKHDIRYIDNTDTYHDALMQIKPATYVYNNDKTETAKLGMIAEDIADVMPIAALTGEGGKVENYDTRAVIAMLVMEVQRLNAEIERLRGDSNAD